MTIYIPDVKLRGLTNFPVSVTGRTGINVVKINGRWYIDYDVSGIVQNSNIPVDQVDQYWFTVWNEQTNSYVNVPYSLAVTAGVGSIDGHTGALEIAYPLQFVGDTLEIELGGILTIATYDIAAAGAVIPNSVTAVRLLGRSSPFDGGAVDAIYVASEPAHEGKWQAPDARWFKFKCKDSVRPEMFGGFPSASLAGADTAPFLSKMINYANIEHPSIIEISEGQWPVDSALPTITYLCKVIFAQTGPENAVIWKRYVEADDRKGVMSWEAYAPNIEGAQFSADVATASGGSFISAILPGTAANIGEMRLTNFHFSGRDGVNYNVTVDGSANNSAGPGYRDVLLMNGFSFGTLNHPWNFKCVHHVLATNVYSDRAGGSSSNAIFFDGTLAVKNDDIQWYGFTNGSVNISWLSFGNDSNFHTPIKGALTIDNSDRVNVYGNIGGALTIGANVTNFLVFGQIAGAVTGTATGISGKSAVASF